jgi:hypothetical protein
MKTIEQINQEGRELFGADFDYEKEIAQTDSIQERLDAQRAAGREMDRYFETIPDFISDEDHFALWMMTDKERAEFIAARNPRIEVRPENAPYFPKQLNANSRQPLKIGGVIVR